MAPRFACADFTFPLLTHDQALDLIALLGFEGVDIGLFQDRSHLQPSGEFADVAGSAARLRQQLADRGLQPADIFLQASTEFAPFAANHPDAARRATARDLFLRALDYTVACGGAHLSGLPGVHFPEESRAASFARCADELAWRCAKARAAAVTFAIEAHVGSIVPNPEAVLRLVRATPGLTLTLDYTHFTRRGVPDARVEPLIAHASHFHARGARTGRLQTAVKDSTIDYARIVEVMQATGYQGYIGIEYVWIDWEHCNEVDNLSESILLRDLIRNAWGG